MRRLALRMTRATTRLVRLAGLVLLVLVVALLTTFVIVMQDRPDLQPWHEVELDAEFTAETGARRFDDYLAAEERVFRQLDERVYGALPAGSDASIERYHRGSLADPRRWPRDWNRSFEMPVDDPRIAVLLLHGLSDSPYSLRGLAQTLHERGAWVLGLRLPGHGTVPAALKDVHWQDMAAALRLAVRHLREVAGKRRIYLVGYSTGGALAVRYALRGLQEREQPQPAGVVLISPAIGVTPLAALAVWQARIGDLLGLDKLAWQDIKPEYDPFKYNSFAVNAGDQIYRLTAEITRLIDQHRQAGDLQELPPILAFQSAVDATVSASAVVEGLFERLPSDGHELMLFDINRQADMEHVLASDPQKYFGHLLERRALPYGLEVVTNRGRDVVILDKPAGESEYAVSPTGLSWPRHVFSLSHVALPIRGDDPLYGTAGRPSPGIYLGDLAFHGERGVLQISAADMLRLRWNPFYSLMERRITAFMGL